MNDMPSSYVVTAIRSLYGSNEHAQRFFDLNAQRERNATETSIDVICRKLEITRGEAVLLAKELEEAGCGKFRNGRRGAKSRFVWEFSCISLGKAAAGEEMELESNDDAEEEDEIEELAPATRQASSVNVADLIAEAKRELAVRSGLSASQIEIQIKV